MEPVFLLKAIADQTRLAIISELRIRPRCVRSLACRMSISSSAVSQHLKILREAQLVFGVKKGYYTHYCLGPVGWRRVEEIARLLPTVDEAANSFERVRGSIDGVFVQP